MPWIAGVGLAAASSAVAGIPGRVSAVELAAVVVADPVVSVVTHAFVVVAVVVVARAVAPVEFATASKGRAAAVTSAGQPAVPLFAVASGWPPLRVLSLAYPDHRVPSVVPSREALPYCRIAWCPCWYWHHRCCGCFAA